MIENGYAMVRGGHDLEHANVAERAFAATYLHRAKTEEHAGPNPQPDDGSSATIRLRCVR